MTLAGTETEQTKGFDETGIFQILSPRHKERKSHGLGVNMHCFKKENAFFSDTSLLLFLLLCCILLLLMDLS